MPLPHDCPHELPATAPPGAGWGFLRAPSLGLALLYTACSLPFLDKAVHVDDTLFLLAARQIQRDPVDFYGFDVNWYGTVMPMARVMQNPPGGAYYLAAVGALFGWSEPALHLGFLPPGLAVVLGTYRLAARGTSRGYPPALMVTASPVFFVSATGLMCDVLMLALYLGAVNCWLRGTREESPPWLLAAGLLAALAALTKYFALSLLPLLLAVTLLWMRSRRRPLRYLALALAALLVPVLAVAAYHVLTQQLYGFSLLTQAAGYRDQLPPRDLPDPLAALLAALEPTVACVGLGALGASAVAVLLGGWRWALASLLALPLLALQFWLAESAGQSPLGPRAGPTAAVFVQLMLAMMAGLFALLQVGLNVYARRDAFSITLALWVLGTVVFCAWLNWTVNARSVLPLLPPLAVALGQRLQQRWPGAPPVRALALCLLPGGMLTLAAAWSDRGLADSYRATAARVLDLHAGREGVLWYQGHWGFQHYMEQGGARALDRRRSRCLPGDWVAVPDNSPNRWPLPEERVRPLHLLEQCPPCWPATMSRAAGAGFYAFGPLPISFVPMPEQSCTVVEVTAPIDYGDRP